MAQDDLRLVPQEESAEFFLEAYEDSFQEAFFEALKQKGIQNYDRAINLLLECKKIDDKVIAIDHELAKAYFLDGQYISAQQYAIECVVTEPENYWFLDTLVAILERQSNTIEQVKQTIPFENVKLQENLALINFKKSRYDKALTLLQNKKTATATDLRQKINDILAQKQKKIANKPPKPNPKTVIQVENPLVQLQSALETLISNEKFKDLETASEEALETYPLQPFFYYAYGLALNKNGKPNEALDVLQTGLDYLFETTETTNDIYREMAAAHTQLGNTSKANEYLSKIKSGL